MTLRMHHFAPPQAPAHALLAGAWAAKLEKDSGGRLRIPVFPALELGGTSGELEAQVREGEVDLALTAPSFTPGRFPRTEIFELPLLGAGAPAATFALQDYFERHLQAEYHDYHVVLLFANDGAALHVKRPVRALDDLKGLKIGAAGRSGGVFLRAVGATAIGAPAAHVPHLLVQGLLDGALAPFAALEEQGLAKLVRHHVSFDERLGLTVYALLMNRGRYLALPAALRKLLDAHSRRNLAWYAGKTWAEIEAPGMAAARAAGNELSALAPAEAARVRAAVAAETERFLADLSQHGRFDAKAMYRDARELIDKYRKP